MSFAIPIAFGRTSKEGNGMIELAVPLTEKQIQIAAELHGTLDQWRVSDNALRRLHRALPGFDEEACVLKAIAVNQLYGTQVLAIIPMAKHVRQVFSQAGAAEKGTDLVDQIAALDHGGKVHRRISFAAKFCHFFVDENGFPIYDEAARQTIRLHLGNQYSNDNTKPYATFCDNFGRLRAAIGFRGQPRAMDRYLWIVGMYMKWKKERLRRTPQINVELRDLFEKPSNKQKVLLRKLLPDCIRTE
jgi:hypothetical protein